MDAYFYQLHRTIQWHTLYKGEAIGGVNQASALEISPDVIRNFREDVIINNVYDQNNTVINYQFNPIEKIVALYDQLLATERKRIELLEAMLRKEQEKKH